MKTSLPAPPVSVSPPLPPVIESLPLPPSITSLPEPPVRILFFVLPTILIAEVRAAASTVITVEPAVIELA